MTIYRAARPDVLNIQPLDALTLIYHRPSGLTHVVDAPVPEILAALKTPMRIDDLLEKLSEDYDLVDADIVALAMRLDELAAVGLVERL